MAADAICWLLAEVNFDDKSSSVTPLSSSVSNLVQIYATVAELWPKMWISIKSVKFIWHDLWWWSQFRDLIAVSLSNLVTIRSISRVDRFQNGRWRHLGFWHMWIFRASLSSKAPFSASASYPVQTGGIMAQFLDFTGKWTKLIDTVPG